MAKAKPLKLTQEVIDKVMIQMRTSKQLRMLKLMNYMIMNPKANLTQTAGHLDIPISSIFDLKYELRKILRELKK